MSYEMFIHPSGTRIEQKIDDIALMKAAVNCFLECNFFSLKCIITEYGENTFFADLNRYLIAGLFRNPANRYMVFSGIVISFFNTIEKAEILPSRMNLDYSESSQQ